MCRGDVPDDSRHPVRVGAKTKLVCSPECYARFRAEYYPEPPAVPKGVSPDTIIHSPSIANGRGWPTACGLPDGVITPVAGNVTCPKCAMVLQSPQRVPNADPSQPMIHGQGWRNRTMCGLDDPKEVVTPVLGNVTCMKCVVQIGNVRPPADQQIGPTAAVR